MLNYLFHFPYRLVSHQPKPLELSVGVSLTETIFTTGDVIN